MIWTTCTSKKKNGEEKTARRLSVQIVKPARKLNDPVTFLPNDLDNKARIMVYNHQSHWESDAFTEKSDAFAQDLLRALEDRQSSDEACQG